MPDISDASDAIAKKYQRPPQVIKKEISKLISIFAELDLPKE
jgi:hypothetical protein